MSLTQLTPLVTEHPETSHRAASRRLWRGLFRDIESEHGFQALRVEGALPSDINGVLYQNGPGLFSAQNTKYGHIFDGDGLARATRIEHGSAFGAARIVQSKGLLAERECGRMVYCGFDTDNKGWQAFRDRARLLPSNKSFFKNRANTNFLVWQDRLLALHDGSKPTELDPETLGTLGETDLGGVVGGLFTAHPHRLPARRTTYAYSMKIWLGKAVLEVYALPDQGSARKITEVKLDQLAFGVHDFAVTKNHLIFFIPPSQIPFRNLAKLALGHSVLSCANWKPDLGSEVIVIPIDDPESVIRFKTDPFLAIHVGNAYESANELVVDFTYSTDLRMYESFANFHIGCSDAYYSNIIDNISADTSVYARANIDIGKRRIRFDTIYDNICEFPRVSSSIEGCKGKYAYMMAKATEYESPYLFDQLVKIDVQDGKATHLDFGDEQLPGEPLFVEKPNPKAEDDGYVLSMVYDGRDHHSYLAVVDAQRFERGPVAKLHFEQALPIMFHGTWRAH